MTAKGTPHAGLGPRPHPLPHIPYPQSQEGKLQGIGPEMMLRRVAQEPGSVEGRKVFTALSPQAGAPVRRGI